MFDKLKSERRLVTDLAACSTPEQAQRTIHNFVAAEGGTFRTAEKLDKCLSEAVQKSSQKRSSDNFAITTGYRQFQANRTGAHFEAPRVQEPANFAPIGRRETAGPPAYALVPNLPTAAEAALNAAQGTYEDDEDGFEGDDFNGGPAYPAPQERRAYQAPAFPSNNPFGVGSSTQAPVQNVTRAFAKLAIDPAVLESTLDEVKGRLDTLELSPLQRRDMERSAESMIRERLARSPADIEAERDAMPVYEDDDLQEIFEHHLAKLPLAESAKGLIRDMGFEMIYAALNGTDVKLVIDRSSSTSGVIADAITHMAQVLAMLVHPFDPTGIDLHFISENRREPFLDVSDPVEIKESIEAVRPEGGTPMATEVQSIASEYVVRLLVNEALPETHQIDVRKLRILLIGDGASEADWQLRVGKASSAGVFIDGIAAPKGSTVTGKITSAHKAEGTFATVDPLVTTTTVYHLDQIDPALAEAIRPGLGGQETFEETSTGRAEGIALDKSKLRGDVLVRVPVDMEKDVVVAFAKHIDALDYPEGQMGLGLIPIGSDEGVRKLFTRLTDVHEQDEYKELNLPDWVSYVPTPENAHEDVEGESLAGYLIKAAASCGNRELDNTDVNDVIRNQREE